MPQASKFFVEHDVIDKSIYLRMITQTDNGSTYIDNAMQILF